MARYIHEHVHVIVHFYWHKARKFVVWNAMISCTRSYARIYLLKLNYVDDFCGCAELPDMWYMLCCRNLFHTPGGWWTLGECLQKRTTHQWQPLQDHRRGERARKRQQGPRGRSGPAERNGQRNQRVHGGHQRRRFEKCHQADLINPPSLYIQFMYKINYPYIIFTLFFIIDKVSITEQVIYTIHTG